MAEEEKKPLRKDDEITGKAYDTRLILRLLRYLKPYWIPATISSVAVLLKSACDVVGPYLTKIAVDKYMTADSGSPAATTWLARHVSPDGVHGITQLATIYFAALILSYGLEFAQTYLMQWTGQKVMFDLRSQIFRHLQRMHVGFFDRNPVGRLVTRITSDVDAVNEMFTAGIFSIFEDVFVLAGIVLIMLRMSWWLALISFTVLPIIWLVTHMFRIYVRSSFRRVRAALARINSFTHEHVSGMSLVQLFNREQRAYTEFTKVNHEHMEAYKDTILGYSYFYPVVDLLSSIGIALVIWVGGRGVLSNSLSLGVLVAFIQYSQRFFRPIQDLSEKYNIMQSAMTACERIFKLLDEKTDITSPANPVQGDGTNRIEFEDVWFTYQELTDDQKRQIEAASNDEQMAAIDGIEWILRGVSFCIEPGETVAIVGHTGAGKTTIISLAMRFYDVQRGAVKLDGVDVRLLELEALRRHFGVVLQDPFLFTGTLAENIRLGTQSITAEQLKQAASDVNILDFIEAQPQGFEQVVRERGAGLSTGQKQLISFARALAHQPGILILDEATSSVDTETELRVRNALARMTEGRTSILIAHRLSTVQRADQILVMHKGQLKEKGTHQQLLGQRGLYWKLYQLQYSEQEPDANILAAPLASGTT